jgi:hypothetical protein
MPNGVPGGLENIHEFLARTFHRSCLFDMTHYRIATDCEMHSERVWAAARADVVAGRHQDRPLYIIDSRFVITLWAS